MVEEDSDESESHMSRDVLALHEDCLAAKCSTLEAVNATTENVELFVVVARQNDVGLDSTRERVDSTLKFIRISVGGSVSGMNQPDTNAVDFHGPLVLSEVVILLEGLREFLTDDNAVVVFFEVPLVMVTIDPVVIEVVQLAVELNCVLELLRQPDLGQFVDVSGSSRHALEVVSCVQDEVRLLFLKELDHVGEQFWLEHAASDVRIGEVAEAERVTRDGDLARIDPLAPPLEGLQGIDCLDIGESKLAESFGQGIGLLTGSPRWNDLLCAFHGS